MLKIIKKVKNPKFLVITPLKENDKISKNTLETVLKNKLDFDWISYEGNNNIPTNTELALKEYEKNNSVDYIIKIDNDIFMDDFLLDFMYYKIKKSDCNVAYVYCGFSYITPNKFFISFNYDFNEKKLLQSNYISSNSMIKRDLLEEIGGFVKDEKYERLLDWCLWLKFLEFGYIGEKIPLKRFLTPLNEGNVSARGQLDYKIKYKRVIRDYVQKIKNN